jgi:glycosyltransferase involved in cell wall biosynthesis
LSSPFKKILAFLLKVVFLKSHAILVISKSVKSELVDVYKIDPKKICLYKYKISNIFNPSVPKSLKPILNPAGPIVLAVSRIDPGKGLHYLVEASKTIVEKIPNVRIVIKGSVGSNASLPEKNYEIELKRLIRKYHLQEHIKILAFSPNSEIPRYMSASDVIVLPSISEGLGVVILEALATGVPVVASRVGGVPDVLMSGTNGLMVEPKDANGLAQAILKILTDDKLRRRLIEGGLRTIHNIEKNEFEVLLIKSMFE